MSGAEISVVVLESDDASEGAEAAQDLARRLVAIALGEPYPDRTRAEIHWVLKRRWMMCAIMIIYAWSNIG